MIAIALSLSLCCASDTSSNHAPFAVADEPPQIVSMEPPNGAIDVDVKQTTKLVVEFDRPMNDRGWSFCGGGDDFPAFKGKPRWDTPRKIVVDVELAPDHSYRLSLNCPSAKNFSSAKGVPLVPVAWTFETAPAKLPNAATQKRENKAALEELKKLLAERYSYYDLRMTDWSALYRRHEAEILGARTPRGWAAATARMLADTQDLHMTLRLGEKTFATGSRAIDPLYRAPLLPRYVPVEPTGEQGLAGRTDDGIGYVMIAAWTSPAEIDAIEKALASLRDCKALIVDVRPNSGGDELLARRVAAWFVDGTKVYAKHRYREKPGKDGFGAVLERSVTGNGEPERRIAVPVAVLTSRYVMSSNESFVLMMKQAEDCTVVGQTTYGSSGNPKSFDLANGVAIVVPTWQDLLPDGTCFEGKGIAPDVEVSVEPQDLEQRDPILDRALALLRSKIR